MSAVQVLVYLCIHKGYEISFRKLPKLLSALFGMTSGQLVIFTDQSVNVFEFRDDVIEEVAAKAIQELVKMDAFDKSEVDECAGEFLCMN